MHLLSLIYIKKFRTSYKCYIIKSYNIADMKSHLKNGIQKLLMTLCI